jgi:hypothetical protein
LDAFLNELVDGNMLNGLVLVEQGDEILLNIGYGMADREIESSWRI